MPKMADKRKYLLNTIKKKGFKKKVMKIFVIIEVKGEIKLGCMIEVIEWMIWEASMRR